MAVVTAQRDQVLSYAILLEHEPAQVRAQHHHQSHGRQSEDRDGGHGSGGQPPHLTRPV